MNDYHGILFSELQSITRELAAEKSSLRADLEKTTMQLSSLQLEQVLDIVHCRL